MKFSKIEGPEERWCHVRFVTKLSLVAEQQPDLFGTGENLPELRFNLRLLHVRGKPQSHPCMGSVVTVKK